MAGQRPLDVGAQRAMVSLTHRFGWPACVQPTLRAPIASSADASTTTHIAAVSERA
jgi:hypothetical protein